MPPQVRFVAAKAHMSAIRLLATDLDGTLVTAQDETDLYDTFNDVLSGLSLRDNMIWVVSTGRSASSFKRVFIPMRYAGLMPDYVITRHAFIHSTSRLGFISHVAWNVLVQIRIWRDSQRSRHLLLLCHRDLVRRFRRTRVVVRERDRICIRFGNNNAVESAAAMVRSMAEAQHNLQVFEFLTHLDIRTIPHTKGLAVNELAKQLGITKADVLTIGDGNNDISMLDGTCACMTGCPANATPSVMAMVHKRGGHIAGSQGLGGTLEVIDAHMNGRVCSDLPATWEDTATLAMANAPSGIKDPHEQTRFRNFLKTSGLICASAITVLLTMARFGMLGGLSGAVIDPFDKIVTFVARIMLAV